MTWNIEKEKMASQLNIILTPSQKTRCRADVAKKNTSTWILQILNKIRVRVCTYKYWITIEFKYSNSNDNQIQIINGELNLKNNNNQIKLAFEYTHINIEFEYSNDNQIRITNGELNGKFSNKITFEKVNNYQYKITNKLHSEAFFRIK